MKKLNIVFIVSIFCMIAVAVAAQEAITTSNDAGGKTYIHVPFSLSFVPGISTSGFMGGDVITNFSINIIAGRYAKLHGFELGYILNWETEEVRGAQFSGVINLLENGDLKGLQLAGVLNYVGRNASIGQIGPINCIRRSLEGFQIGSVVNYVGSNGQGTQIGNINYLQDNFKGAQMGIVNYTGDSFEGAQIGNFNYAGGNLKGAQIGNFNFIGFKGDGFNRGAQIGVVNIGWDLIGAQVGVINVARSIEGAQVGVINYADKMKGVPIGLLSIVRNGEIHLDVWASETSLANIALKTGTKRAYSILALGYQPVLDGNPYRWSPGVGVGIHFPSGRQYINLEALSFHINEDEGWTDELHRLNKFRLIAGWEVDPRISVFAGLTLNVFISNVNDGDHISIASFLDVESSSEPRWVRMWPGFVAGFQF